MIEINMDDQDEKNTQTWTSSMTRAAGPVEHAAAAPPYPVRESAQGSTLRSVDAERNIQRYLSNMNELASMRVAQSPTLLANNEAPCSTSPKNNNGNNNNASIRRNDDAENDRRSRAPQNDGIVEEAQDLDYVLSSSLPCWKRAAHVSGETEHVARSARVYTQNISLSKDQKASMPHFEGDTSSNTHVFETLQTVFEEGEDEKKDKKAGEEEQEEQEEEEEEENTPNRNLIRFLATLAALLFMTGAHLLCSYIGSSEAITNDLELIFFHGSGGYCTSTGRKQLLVFRSSLTLAVSHLVFVLFSILGKWRRANENDFLQSLTKSWGVCALILVSIAYATLNIHDGAFKYYGYFISVAAVVYKIVQAALFFSFLSNLWISIKNKGESTPRKTLWKILTFACIVVLILLSVASTVAILVVFKQCPIAKHLTISLIVTYIAVVLCFAPQAIFAQDIRRIEKIFISCAFLCYTCISVVGVSAIAKCGKVVDDIDNETQITDSMDAEKLMEEKTAVITLLFSVVECLLLVYTAFTSTKALQTVKLTGFRRLRKALRSEAVFHCVFAFSALHAACILTNWNVNLDCNSNFLREKQEKEHEAHIVGSLTDSESTGFWIKVVSSLVSVTICAIIAFYKGS